MSWFDDALAKGVELASSELEGEPQQAAVAAIHELGAASEAIDRLGKSKLRAVVALFNGGEVLKARAMWIKTEASYLERRQAMQEATAAHRKAREQLEADWEDFWAAVGKATLRGLKIATPFLLAAVGI